MALFFFSSSGFNTGPESEAAVADFQVELVGRHWFKPNGAGQRWGKAVVILASPKAVAYSLKPRFVVAGTASATLLEQHCCLLQR